MSFLMLSLSLPLRLYYPLDQFILTSLMTLLRYDSVLSNSP